MPFRWRIYIYIYIWWREATEERVEECDFHCPIKVWNIMSMTRKTPLGLLLLYQMVFSTLFIVLVKYQASILDGQRSGLSLMLQHHHPYSFKNQNTCITSNHQVFAWLAGLRFSVISLKDKYILGHLVHMYILINSRNSKINKHINF
jgi:urea transporter